MQQNVYYVPPAPITQRVWFVGIGVSNYANGDFLRYSTKDIKDLDSTFRLRYKDALIDTLVLDNQVSVLSTHSIRQFLSRASIDDMVIIAFSGHGYVDDSLNFYLAVNDAGRPQKITGIPYTHIIELLNSTLARKRLLLLDACNSGDLDEQLKSRPKIDTQQTDLKSFLISSTKDILDKKKGGNVGNQDNFNLMQELFTNLQSVDGNIIISASRGNQLANEGATWGNGALTYSIVQGLAGMKADFDSDGFVTINELKDFTIKNVPRITAGKQNPALRQDVPEADWNIW